MEKINDCLHCKYCSFYHGRYFCNKAHVILHEYKTCKRFVFEEKKETTSVSWFEKRFNKVL